MIDREQWQRRFQRAPELRPEGARFADSSLMIDGKYEGGLALRDNQAAALICWQAVQWLAKDNWEVSIACAPDSPTPWSLVGTGSYASAIDALGAALDAVLDAREAKV